MKFYGNIAFRNTAETLPDVWTEEIKTKTYYGDVQKLSKRNESGEHVIDGLRINTSISVLMDPWMSDNFQNILYVEYMNSKWKVESAEILYPRIVLTLGGLYNVEDED